MKADTRSDNVWFTTKGQVVIPLWMRKEFHIEEGSRAVVVATDEGILLKPVTKRAIARLHGILKRKPGGKMDYLVIVLLQHIFLLLSIFLLLHISQSLLRAIHGAF